MNKKKRIAILKRLKENNQYSDIELIYSSIFELLIAILLSSRTTDLIVNKVTAKLYSIANTPKELLALGIDNIKSYIKPVGLFNKKAEYIIKTCQILLSKYNGRIPEDQKTLESLPGIGHKAANLLLNIAFGKPIIAVDTHVFRVCNRTGFASGKNVKQVEKKLIKLVPIESKVYFHRLFVFHGRYICRARKPRCELCVISDLCKHKIKMK